MNATMLRLSALLLCLASSSVQAIDNITIKLDFTPDLDDGRKVYSICARCHLPEAWGNADGTFPQLAGQHVNVLMKQLLDIRSGARHSSLMFPFVQQRTIGGYQQLSDVVAYISTLPMNPDHARGPWNKHTAEYSEGKAVYEANCSVCHGKNGEGDNALAYPKLQGQHFQYMNQQLAHIKAGRRHALPAMTSVVTGLSDEQLEKAVNYVSYFEVPAADKASSRNWRNPDFNEE